MGNEEIVSRLDIIISLLARSGFSDEDVRRVIVQGKQNPARYIKAYHAMDGSLGVTQLSKIAGVTQSAMSQVIGTWETSGIAVNVGTKHSPNYRKLFTIR